MCVCLYNEVCFEYVTCLYFVIKGTETYLCVESTFAKWIIAIVKKILLNRNSK